MIYSYCCEPKDYCCLETEANVITVNNTNFINISTVFDYIFYVTANNALILDNCIVWNSDNKRLCYNNYAAIVHSCRSNSQNLPGFEYLSEFDVDSILLRFICNNNIISCNKISNSNFSFLIFNFVFLIK